MPLSHSLQSYYLAFYGRPADANGLAYWQSVWGDHNANDLNLIHALGSQEQSEFTEIYGEAPVFSDFMQQVYGNLFGHTASSAQATQWQNWAQTKQLEGVSEDHIRTQFVSELIQSKLPQDARVLKNKVSFASALTQSLDATVKVTAYENNSDLRETVQKMLGKITSSHESYLNQVIHIDEQVSHFATGEKVLPLVIERVWPLDEVLLKIRPPSGAGRLIVVEPHEITYFSKDLYGHFPFMFDAIFEKDWLDLSLLNLESNEYEPMFFGNIDREMIDFYKNYDNLFAQHGTNLVLYQNQHHKYPDKPEWTRENMLIDYNQDGHFRLGDDLLVAFVGTPKSTLPENHIII